MKNQHQPTNYRHSLDCDACTVSAQLHTRTPDTEDHITHSHTRSVLVQFTYTRVNDANV